MSSIAFHTATTAARISGREHGRFGLLLKERSWQHLLAAYGSGLAGSTLQRAVNWPGWVAEDRPRQTGQWANFTARAELAHNVSGQLGVRLPNGQRAGTVLDVALNSVTAGTADDVTALAVRLYGQCEMHGWIAAEDRAWAADIIDVGRRRGVLNDHASINVQYEGWPGVVDLLRNVDLDEPVVMSYSVSEWFPNRLIAEADPEFAAVAARCCPRGCDECADEEWEGLSDRRRWELGVAGLRHRSVESFMLRICPANLHQPSFGVDVAVTWADLAREWAAAPAAVTP